MALRLDRRSEALLERTDARPPASPPSSRSASTATSSASATDLGFTAAGLRRGDASVSPLGKTQPLSVRLALSTFARVQTSAFLQTAVE